MDYKQCLQQLLSDRPFAYQPMFAKMLKDASSAIFLSLLAHWHGKGKDPDGFIYKTQEEIYDETGLSRWNQETARKKLKELGILEEKRKGIPAKMHYRLNIDALIECLKSFHNASNNDNKQQCGTTTNGKEINLKQQCGNPTLTNVASPQTITKTTTEETTEERKSINTFSAKNEVEKDSDELRGENKKPVYPSPDSSSCQQSFKKVESQQLKWAEMLWEEYNQFVQENELDKLHKAKAPLKPHVLFKERVKAANHFGKEQARQIIEAKLIDIDRWIAEKPLKSKPKDVGKTLASWMRREYAKNAQKQGKDKRTTIRLSTDGL